MVKHKKMSGLSRKQTCDDVNFQSVVDLGGGGGGGGGGWGGWGGWGREGGGWP